MKISILILLFVLLFQGCGYKPTSYYAKDKIKGTVYVDTKIDIENSQNSILVKDATNNILLNQFKATIVDEKEKADMLIFTELISVDIKALQTDNYGYSLVYRATTTIAITYSKNSLDSVKNKIIISNYYDYIISNDSLTTEQNKLNAIKIASEKALSNLFSKIAINSFK